MILTTPLDTVVDTIVRSSAGSATSGIVVEGDKICASIQVLEAVFSMCALVHAQLSSPC